MEETDNIENNNYEQQEEDPRRLIKSVSAPNYRGKGFVRPNCSTTFWLQCPVCCKRYFKYDSHFECFSRWCEICQDVLPTAAALKQHGLVYHRKNYCSDCNHVYENIRGHRTYEHAGTGAAAPETVGKLSGAKKKVKLTRATTISEGVE